MENWPALICVASIVVMFVVPAFVSFAETSLIERLRAMEHALPQFRGVGARIVKSAELLSVSMEPSPLRTAAELFVVFGVGAVS